MRFLDSWLHGASPDIGSARCNTIFQASNRTIGCILKRSARLYGDCMEPDHMAKYSLPMLTDLTENLIRKKPTFYVLTPLQFWGCFWTRLGILRSPMWFLSKKLKYIYWRNYARACIAKISLVRKIIFFHFFILLFYFEKFVLEIRSKVYYSCRIVVRIQKA
jgi:hypothetical protein